MNTNSKSYEIKIEISPKDWLYWDDDKFNEWRRINDFPRIIEFLSDSLPELSQWLSEQNGLTIHDLLINGPARFIRYYNTRMVYVEYDATFNVFKDTIKKPHIIRDFFRSDEIKSRTSNVQIIRNIHFTSYIDWAIENKIEGITDIIRHLTPTGSTSDSPSGINNYSNIQFNIPRFMPKVYINEIKNLKNIKSPPKLELLKLGGNNVEIVDGLIGNKNLEFVNMNNLTLVNPIITSNQNLTYSTLCNTHLIGNIHIAILHQCKVDISCEDSILSNCDFDGGFVKIKLSNSKLSNSSIRSSIFDLKTKDTEVTSCDFKYFDLSDYSNKRKSEFHRNVKMFFSHLGYPDLAGDNYFIEKSAERVSLYKKTIKLKRYRITSFNPINLLKSSWMLLQEIYWGYGEKPFRIIKSSIVIIFLFSILCYYSNNSETQHDIIKSLIFSIQSFTNITIKKIEISNDIINLIGAFFSFLGIFSIGLLISSLSSKTKNYN